MTGQISYRYPLRALLPQYIRGSFGLALTAGSLLFADTTNTVSVILGSGVVAFSGYLAHAVLCNGSVIISDENSIAVGGISARRINWIDLSDLRLRYFSTRRDGENGWMQLVLKKPGVSIRIESTLTGFKDIVTISIISAHQRGLQLSPSTLENLKALGIDTRKCKPTSVSACRIS